MSFFVDVYKMRGCLCIFVHIWMMSSKKRIKIPTNYIFNKKNESTTTGPIRWGHGGRVPPLFQIVGI